MGSFPSIFYLIFLTIPSGREDRYCYLQMTDEGLIAQVPVNPSQGFTTTKWLGLAQGLCCSFRKETVGSGKRMWRSVGRGSCWRGAVVPCTAYPLCVRWSKMLTPCRGFLPLSLTTEVSHIFFVAETMHQEVVWEFSRRYTSSKERRSQSVYFPYIVECLCSPFRGTRNPPVGKKRKDRFSSVAGSPSPLSF